MKISLFKKYLLITLSIILASFVILGAFLMSFVTQYWKDSERDNVRNSIEDISELVSDAVETSNGSLWIGNQKTWDLIVDLSKSYHYDLIVTDSNGKVFKTTRRDDTIKRDYMLPEKAVNSVITNKYYEETQYTGNFYDDTQICVAAPVRVQIGLTITTAGYVFLCSSNSMSLDLPMQIFQILIYAVIAALIVAGFLTGFFSYSQTRPLKEMSIQARKFAKGDFSGRITVRGKDEIGLLTKAFNDMADSLEKEEKVRRDFIANISHELKTPMTTIAGFIDGILDGTIPRNAEDHYLSIVSEEIQRLSTLVGTMLNLARIDSGKTVINKSDFNVLSVIVNILVTFEDRLENKEISIKGLESADGLEIHGDRDMLYQALYNLIENAVKFTPQKGTITFNFEVRDNRLYFSIKNTGKGISPEDLPFLFDKFYKTDKSRSEDKKSMGLGLYIVKTIINLHSGEIMVTSSVDKETCFSAWIPEK